MSEISRRLGNLLGRGVVSLVNSAGKLQALQLRLLSGEVKDRVEHFEPYGFTSHPLPGAEHLTVFLDGDRSHGITVVVADRRYRLMGLPAGGVALFDSADSSFVLSADGKVKVTASIKVEIESPLTTVSSDLHVAGDVIAQGDVIDNGSKSAAAMRGVFNDHDHDQDGGGITDKPNQNQ